MEALRVARTKKGISQQELSRLTGINQGTISGLEREVISPTCNQRTLLEQALGPIAWPVERPFSDVEKVELIQAFAILVNRQGPRRAIDLLSKTKSLDELRGMASLFAPPTDFEEPLELPNHNSNGGQQ